MGYKPTLGGLKKAQGFLESKGWAMPIFQTDIYSTFQMEGMRQVPVGGQTVSLDEAIQEHGAACRVMDVQLMDEGGEAFVRFSDITHFGVGTMQEAMLYGWDVKVEFHKEDKFKGFMDSADGSRLVNIARWGKPTVSVLGRIMFFLCPRAYAAYVFV